MAVDLFGLDATAARERLLAAARSVRAKPTAEPTFPGAGPADHVESPRAPTFPGRLPAVWNVPARNRNFIGRSDVLTEVRTALTGNAPVAVTVVHGLGGVGKSQLAAEFAHRHAAEYDVAWWINADQPVLLGEQVAALAPRLGLRVTGQVPEDAAMVLDALRRGRFLVVFDNAQSPADLRPWLPGGSCHVLVTSRHPVGAGSRTASRSECSLVRSR